MFDKSFDRVFTNEGGFQDDPQDRGNWTSGVIGEGELRGTKYGISAMAYPLLDIRNLTRDCAKRIYKKDWWDKNRMDRFRPSMQYQMFDAAVNHGMFNASKIFQRALEVPDDGIIGPKTMAASVATDVDDVLLRFLAERLIFLTNVRTWDRYGKGWARRIAHNLKIASSDN